MKNIEQTLTSMEVAEMVDKRHDHLMRDIKKYLTHFNDPQIGGVDFFRETTYTDAKGESRPCYQITKKGCEFIANKLTGIKGTEFTAKYVNRFHEMQTFIEEKQADNAIAALQKELQAQRTMLQSIMRSVEPGRWLASRPRTQNEAYKAEILKAIEHSQDTHYLMGVYTFAVTYPDTSKGTASTCMN